MSAHEHCQCNVYKCIAQIPIDPIDRDRFEMFERSAILFRSIHESTRQSQQHSLKETRSQSKLPKISSEYKAMVQNYFASMTTGKSFSEFVKAQGQLGVGKLKEYKHLLGMWELCDILYFTDGDKRKTGTRLLQWINDIDKSSHNFDIQGIMRNQEGPIEHRDFWSCVNKLIFRRDFQNLIQLLKKVKSQEATSKEAAQLIDYLLWIIVDIPPIPDNLDDMVQTDKYWSDRTRWREKVYKTANSLQKARVPSVMMHQKSLLSALGILHGEPKTIANCASNAAEAIISLIVNAHPFAAPNDIRTIANNEPDLSLNQKDERFYSYAMMIQGNIGCALETFKLNDWWTLVHLVDLFGLVEESNYVTTIDVQLFNPDDDRRYDMHFRSFLILVYVRMLSQQSSLWHYGLDYLKTCGTLGRAALMDYIQSMPVDHHFQAKKVKRLLEHCMERDYVKEVVEIWKCLAERGIENTYSEIIRYLCGVGDFSSMEQICELAVYHFARTGELTDIDTLESRLDNYSEPLPQVSFFIQFYKLHVLYEKQEFDEAIELLYDLLMSDDTDPKFIPLLVVEGGNELEGKDKKKLMNL
ncbi:nucleoporin Nup85-like protein [Zychaea mexicana]|uniref:nucleoporin Nup85-like protein n=1 Tax=Zychaea mexicana TaxID=64656 RepID=UPI0022FE1FE7|nr:nucleoporin Nup85-like protein [Zychaea mexicana]KAI9484333.1 nucleoporin Nup85-like protein [Zychaea mexicana]